MNKILLLISLIFVIFTGCSSSENSTEIINEIKDNTIGSPLIEKELFSGQLEIKVPSSFQIMGEEMAQVNIQV